MKSAARISFAISAILRSIEASMRASALVPLRIVRALNFIRLMSVSSAPILRKLFRIPSMRRVARSSRFSGSASSSSSRRIDELLDDPRVAARVLEQLQDLLEDHGVVGEGLVDLRLALLDALGDLDLALAVEQLDRAHLAQVHAHRVVGLLDGLARFLGRLALAGRAAPRRPIGVGDDLDAELSELLVDELEILRRGGRLVRQDRVDFLVEQVALLPTALDEQLDLGKLVLQSLGPKSSSFPVQLRNPPVDLFFFRRSSSIPNRSPSARLIACWSAELSVFK